MKIKKNIMALTGLVISITATVYIILAITGHSDGMMMVKGIAGSVISLIIGRGLGYACKCVLAILRFGLMRIPVYPFDFLTFILGTGVGVIIIVSIPFIFVIRSILDEGNELAVN